MSFPDLQKRAHRIDDARNETPLPHGMSSPARRRLRACLIVLVVSLLTFSACRPPTCWRLATGAFLRQRAPSPVNRGAGDRVAGDWPGNQLLTAKHQETTTSSAAPAAAPTVLECFQVAQPVLTPRGATYSPPADGHGSNAATGDGRPPPDESCTVVLMEHTFAWSYDKPFIGNYTPPSCQFNRVVMNFTVTSQGRQYDRLALMYFGDTEVWRTSTAEPTAPPGIRWVYLKDMTQYLYFWKSPQKLIFDLGNLVDDTYTGSFNTTLTATFFTSDVETDAAPPSDLIIPISKRQGAADAVSQFTLPVDNATNTVGFPRNARRAVFSVSACGQASEEFWWSNVLQSDVKTFSATGGDFPGLSPFREVQVLVDGHVAGLQWPFPVIFTGGVVPGLHRPIAGIDAFDLREHEIDITPFLPLLCDGAEHTFTIRVAGLDDDSGSSAVVTDTVGDNWYVTGKIFVWLDDDDASITTGDAPTIEASPPTITLSHELGQTADGTNETLAYGTEVKRTFATSGRVVTQRSSHAVSWTQTLSYSNKGYISGFGYNQVNDVLVEGADRSSGPASYGADYRYPLFANTTAAVSDQGNLTLQARLVQGLRLRVHGSSVFPTGLEAFAGGGGGSSLLDTTKDGTATFYQTGDGRNSSGFGESAQVFSFGDDIAELFFRNVSAVNGSIVYDHVRVGGDGGSTSTSSGGSHGAAQPGAKLFAAAPAGGGTGPRAFMGRGQARAGLESS